VSQVDFELTEEQAALREVSRAMLAANCPPRLVRALDATFFDPYVSYELTSALEPVGVARRIPLGEASRWALVGLDERMSARRAREIGLVSELVPGRSCGGAQRSWPRSSRRSHPR
jgi:enoyl-CoA hydratase/carnithine racemase